MKTKKNNLDNLIRNINHNINREQQLMLNSICTHFTWISYICRRFNETIRRYNNLELNVNTVNNEMPGLIPQNILNQHHNITFKQLLNYVINKIHSIAINSINRIINIINLWNGRDVNKLIDEIINNINPNYSETNNIIQLFLNFCDNHLDQDSAQEIRNSSKFLINLLKHIQYMKFYRLVEGIKQTIINDNNLMNFDFNDKCTKAMIELYNSLNRQNLLNTRGKNLIYEFARVYNMIVSQIDDKPFLMNTFKDYQNEYDDGQNEYDDGQNDDIDNTVAFGKQLSNEITMPVVNMLINIMDQIKDQILNNNHLNDQQIEELIKNNVSHCIEDITQASNDIVMNLIDPNNLLSNTYTYENDNQVTKKVIESIIEGNDQLNQLKEPFNLH